MFRYHLLLTLWFLTDLLLFIASFAIAYVLRVGPILSTNYPLDRHITVAALVAPVWLIVLFTTRTFALNRKQASLRNAAYIIYGSLVGVALFALTYYFLYGLFFSRLLIIYAFCFSVILTYTWHICFEYVKRYWLRKNPITFPTVIVGITRESEAFVKKLNRTKSPLCPGAIFDARGSKQSDIDGIPVLGKLNKLDAALSNGVTHLVQCSNLEQSINLLQICQQKGITYLLLPSVLGVVGGNERVDDVEGKSLTVVEPERHWWQWFV